MIELLDLLTHREDIQRRATEELGKRFKEFDINCIAVLISRPESTVAPNEEDPIDRLFDQAPAGRKTQLKIFRPYGAKHLAASIPRACARGYVLKPLRGWTNIVCNWSKSPNLRRGL